ncbi:NAD(P)H-hydrate dehydratase [Caulobacter sp. SLTY]|uniref:NAD(P)H-hydrate dehydratase n=1 Tax=Caulobacter sp. SLTY TaxID=2683262 RepID=UPI001412F62C|nr:NAD(P)H-hydrate dehydratase [Caulobacter sp. SLTY]NBB14098.1 NAD(P)H-hydrate dehydratase [Caulobacter sp. SLTY]
MTPTPLTPDLLAGWPLPAPPPGSDKDARGRALVVAGGAQTPGAAVLAGIAALRAGAGKLQMAAATPWAQALAFALPEARVVPVAATAEGEIAAGAARTLNKLAARSDAVVVGPGMMDDAVACPLAARMVAAAPLAAFVLDAGAVTGLAPLLTRLAGKGEQLVLTPHAGEMAAVLEIDKDRVLADPIDAGRRLSDALGAVVVMKGQVTHILAPDRCWVHEGGVEGLGTSGSGDVLAGLIGGLLARGAAPAQAACWGVAIHGAAGRRLSGTVGPLGFLAREIAGEVPRLLHDWAR